MPCPKTSWNVRHTFGFQMSRDYGTIASLGKTDRCGDYYTTFNRSLMHGNPSQRFRTVTVTTNERTHKWCYYFGDSIFWGSSNCPVVMWRNLTHAKKMLSLTEICLKYYGGFQVGIRVEFGLKNRRTTKLPTNPKLDFYS